MIKLVDCKCGCGESFEPKDMHGTRSHVMQLSKKCHDVIRKRNRDELHRKQQAELANRIADKKSYRESKKKHELDALEVTPIKKPLSKSSKMLAVDMALFDRDMKRLEKEYEL